MDAKLEKRLTDAKGKVASVEARRAEIAGQLATAKQALTHAESEHEATLAAAGLGETADLARSRKALDAAREHVAKLEAATRKLERDHAAALREVADAERAILQAQIADLDKEAEALYSEAVRLLSTVWKAAQGADTGHLRPYDRAQSMGVSEGKAHVWRALIALAREANHQLTLLEQVNPAAFAEAGGVDRRTRDNWLQSTMSLIR